MSAFEAFATSFLGHTAANVKERKDRARNYFDDQMERAQTRGRAALAQRQEAVAPMLNTARNLRDQANMPEHIVRVLANEGQGALNSAYQIYLDALNKEIEVDSNFWEQTYNFATEIAGEGSLEEFINQALGLFPSNLEATRERGGDPFGAFVSAGLGYGAMDRARDRLSTTEVEGGFSAQDLLRMESTPLNTRPLGDTGFSENMAFVNQQIQEASQRTSQGDRQPSPNDVVRMANDFSNRVDAAFESDMVVEQAMLRPGDPPVNREEVRRRAQERVAIEYFEMFSATNPAYLKNFPPIWNALPQEYKDMIEAEDSLEDAVPDVLPQEGGPSPVEGDIITTPLPPAGDTQELPVEPEVQPDSNRDSRPEAPSNLPTEPPSNLPEVGQAFRTPAGPLVFFQGVDQYGNLVFMDEYGNGLTNTPEEYEQALELGVVPTENTSDFSYEELMRIHRPEGLPTFSPPETGPDSPTWEDELVSDDVQIAQQLNLSHKDIPVLHVPEGAEPFDEFTSQNGDLLTLVEVAEIGDKTIWVYQTPNGSRIGLEAVTTERPAEMTLPGPLRGPAGSTEPKPLGLLERLAVPRDTDNPQEAWVRDAIFSSPYRNK